MGAPATARAKNRWRGAGVHGQEQAARIQRPARRWRWWTSTGCACRFTPSRVSGPRSSGRRGRARAADGGPAHRVHRQDRRDAIPGFWRFPLDGRVCRSRAADAAIVKCCRASSFSPVKFWQPPRTGRNDERLASGLVPASKPPGRRPGTAGGGWSGAPTGDLTNRYPAGRGQAAPSGAQLAFPAAGRSGSGRRGSDAPPGNVPSIRRRRWGPKRIAKIIAALVILAIIASAGSQLSSTPS